MNFKKPHFYLWIISLLVLLIGFISLGNDTTIDLNIHDSYYVIPSVYISLIISVIYFMLGTGYWLFIKMKRNLFQKLTYFHLIISVGSFVFYWMLILYHKIFISKQEELFNDGNFVNKFIMIVFFLNLVAQPLYILNLISSLFRNKKV